MTDANIDIRELYQLYRVSEHIFYAKAPLPDNSYEESILAQYSTPGLKRNGFTRLGKKEWLDFAHPKMTKAERDELLDKLFPEERQTNV
jgi:hypothetical protein